MGQRNGELLLTKGVIESVDDVVAQIEAVTAEDVRKVAQRVIRGTGCIRSVVGPDLNEDEIDAAMA